MTFSAKLKSLMKERGINLTALSAATGISKSSISQYTSGKNVPRGDRLELLAGALGVEAETFSDSTEALPERGSSAGRLSVELAAKLMGVNPQAIRVGLQREKFPFGFAVKNDGSSHYWYYISPKLFTEYTGIEVPKGGEGA